MAAKTHPNPSDKGLTQKQVRVKLDSLRKRSHMKDPQAYLLSTEHYDVSPKGETKADWVREVVESSTAYGNYAPYVVEYNFGSSYTSAAVVVLAGHPDGALQTADEWWCTRYYDSDPDACDEARGSGEGVVSVRHLMEVEANPGPRKTNPTTSSSASLIGKLKF